MVFSSASCVCRCFSGTLRGSNVVVKYLKDEASEIDAQDLQRELDILRVIRHPNIVKLVGAGLKPQVTRSAPQGGGAGGVAFASGSRRSWFVGHGRPSGDWVISCITHGTPGDQAPRAWTDV